MSDDLVLQAERIVLGTCMSEPAAIETVAEMLTTGDFRDQRHGTLYACLIAATRPANLLIRSPSPTGYAGAGNSPALAGWRTCTRSTPPRCPPPTSPTTPAWSPTPRRCAVPSPTRNA